MRWQTLTFALLSVAAGIMVFHPALGYFFSQDDFVGIAHATGHLPRLTQPWRFLANQAVWDVMHALAGKDPRPYHVLSLVAHCACVVLLYRLIARRVSAWAAFLGATFFAVHPSHFTAVHWISAIGDPVALCLGLLALAASERSDRWRWVAVPLYALSLLTKESLITLPAVVFAYRLWTAPAGARRRALSLDGPMIAMLALAVVYVGYFLTMAYSTYFGAPQDLMPGTDEPSSPYAPALGANLLWNLLTFLGWTVAFLVPMMSHFSNALDPEVYPWAIGAIVLWLGGLLSRRLRECGWWFGGVAWFLLVLPVLPLANHIYHYYLYAPLAGASFCLAAASEWLLGFRAHARRAGVARPLAWALVGLAAIGLTVNGILFSGRQENEPFVLPELRSSALIDRARIAERVYQSLAAANLPPGTTLLFWSPIASTLGPHGEVLAAPTERETYWEANVRMALLDGLAVRVLFPQVREVHFVREFRPAPSNCRYAVYRPEGKTGIVTPEELESIIEGAGSTH